jgi:hypothetical protein
MDTVTTTYEIGQTIRFAPVNAYMLERRGEGPFTGTVERRNKRSLTVSAFGGLVTVPFEFIRDETPSGGLA